MTPTANTPSADLALLLRWEESGGTWQVLHKGNDSIDLALCTCVGGEEVDRLHSSSPDVLAHVGHREQTDNH